MHRSDVDMETGSSSKTIPTEFRKAKRSASLERPIDLEKFSKYRKAETVDDKKLEAFVEDYYLNKFQTEQRISASTRQMLIRFGVEVSKHITNQKSMDSMAILATQMKEGFDNLSARIAQLEKEKEPQTKIAAQLTFAEMAKKHAEAKPEGIKSVEPDEIATKEMKKFSVLEMDQKVDDEGFILYRGRVSKKLKNRNVRVEKIIKTGSGNIALEYENREQQARVEQILRSEPLEGVKLRSSTIRQVDIALRGIPKELSEDDVKAELIDENPDHPFLISSDWDLKLLKQTNQGAKYQIGKLTTPLESARILLKQPKLYLQYVTINAELWKPNHKRCNQCFEIGHVRASCRSGVRCYFCGGDHDVSRCTSRKDHPDCVKCIVCARSKQKADHKATLQECPILMKEQMDKYSRVYKNVYG